MILITEKLILNMGRNTQKLINAIKGLDAIVNIYIGIGMQLSVLPGNSRSFI